MATPLVILVAQARSAGVVISRGPGAALVLRAPKDAAPHAKQLRSRESDVLALCDWRHARLEDPEPCLLCRQPAILRDPAERQPSHKCCVDALLDFAPPRPGRSHPAPRRFRPRS